MRVKDIVLTHHLTFDHINDFIELANRYESEIFLSSIEGSYQINAKSILGLLSIFAKKGTTITITTKGEDELEAVRALGEWIEASRIKTPYSQGKKEGQQR